MHMVQNRNGCETKAKAQSVQSVKIMPAWQGDSQMKKAYGRVGRGVIEVKEFIVNRQSRASKHIPNRVQQA